MDEREYQKILEGIVDLNDEQVGEQLELLVNAPMTYDGYRLSFYGMSKLRRACGAEKQDTRFREATYQRVIKMLESEPEPSDSEAIRLQTDYATSLFSGYSNSVPEGYALKLREAVRVFNERAGEEDSLLKRFILDRI